MRVLIASSCFPPAWKGGGSVRSIGALSRGLVLAGAEVRVVTTDSFLAPDERPPRVREDGGMRIETCCTPAWLGRRANVFGAAPRFLPAVRRAAGWAEVCLAQGLWTLPLALGSRVCARRAVPYVLCAQGALETLSLSEKAWKKRLYMRLFERQTLTSASAVLFNSEHERRRSAQAAGHLPAIVLPNALESVPRRTPPPGALQDRLGIPRDRLLVGVSGRISPRKGLEVLLPALASADPRIHCVAFGPDDGHGTRVLRLAREHGISARVHLLGHRAGAELEETYAGCDLLAVPSRGESFGYTALEALAQGTPVMMTDRVPLASYVAERGLGTIVRDASPDGWSRALRGWAAGSSRFAPELAVASVRRDFAVETIGARLLAFLRALAVDRRTGAPPR